ncbi:MAG: glycosyltransferase family 39 protein, partial [Mycobacterium sp.]|nr:glycosyltransferase family 39 protein [Mycobacterium sp.]
MSLQQRPPVLPVHRTAAKRRSFDPVVVAAVAVGISAAGAARPSLWFDEAATISASTRSPAQLWRMVGNIDAVHGLYYLLMRGWYAVFPATEFGSRLSSALAVGLAAAGVVVLGRQISTRTVAVAAGLVFAVLPRVTWAGMETRSYALSMAAAVWLTVFCVLAARRGRPWWWLAYALLLASATLLNVFLLLIVPAHAVAVALAGSTPRDIRLWAAAATGAATAVTPFLMFTQSQLFQVRWIAQLGSHTVGEVLEKQYFDRSLPAALGAGAILLAALVCGSWPATGRPGRLLPVLALTWIAVPTATLLAYSALRNPIYYPRYLSFTAPAFALLLGLCIVALARSRIGVAVVLACFAVAATPNYLAQRGPYAKENMDYSAVADVIDRNAAPGDCLVLDNSAAWKPGPIRPLTAARPDV